MVLSVKPIWVPQSMDVGDITEIRKSGRRLLVYIDPS
jgi:hypothetical protein